MLGVLLAFGNEAINIVNIFKIIINNNNMAKKSALRQANSKIKGVLTRMNKTLKHASVPAVPSKSQQTPSMTARVGMIADRSRSARSLNTNAGTWRTAINTNSGSWKAA